MARVLDYIRTRRFAPRNRAMMLLTHQAGLRVGEVACLRWSDVINLDGTVKDEIRLLPDMEYANFAHAKDSALELHWHRRWPKTRGRLPDQPTGIDCNRVDFASNLSGNTRHHCKSHGGSQLIM